MTDMISLHALSDRQVTCISNTFIDHYMAEADGEYVKIYLYLLRTLSGRTGAFSLSDLSDLLGHTERDIRKALEYWEKCHLLRLEYDSRGQLVGLCLIDPDLEEHGPLTVHLKADLSGHTEDRTENSGEGSTAAHDAQKPADAVGSQASSAGETSREVHTAAAGLHSAAAASTRENPEKVSDREEIPQGPSFTMEDRAKIAADDDSKELLYVTEQFIGRPLNQNEMDLVLFWHWTLGFSVDMIEFLVEQCTNAGHTSIHYMNKVAIGWKEKGITTEEEARLSSNVHSKAYYAILKAFGIQGRNLTPKEEEYLQKWTREYAFTNEMISEACQRTIANTGRASFEYADSILNNWNKAHIHSLEEVRAEDQRHNTEKRAEKGRQEKGKSDFSASSHTYNDEALNELEKKLLQ